MNLAEWQAMSSEQQQKYIESARPFMILPFSENKVERKCDKALLEFREAIKQELAGEDTAATKYANFSKKLEAIGRNREAAEFELIAGQEIVHGVILQNIVDLITSECGE
jgi:hypothetical protein